MNNQNFDKTDKNIETTSTNIWLNDKGLTSKLNPFAPEFYPSYLACYNPVNNFSDELSAAAEEQNPVTLESDQMLQSQYYQTSNNNNNVYFGEYEFDGKQFPPPPDSYNTTNTAYTGYAMSYNPMALPDKGNGTTVYFNGYGNIGAQNFSTCPMYYGPNMYYPTCELYSAQSYHQQQQQQSYSSNMKSKETESDYGNEAESDMSIDQQLKILYKRPVPKKKSRAIEIKSPTPSTSANNQQQIAANESHISHNKIIKKSMSEQQFEFSYKNHFEFLYHSADAGILIMPKLKFSEMTNLSKMNSGSLNLHTGSTTTIADNSKTSQERFREKLLEDYVAADKKCYCNRAKLREWKFGKPIMLDIAAAAAASPLASASASPSTTSNSVKSSKALKESQPAINLNKLENHEANINDASCHQSVECSLENNNVTANKEPSAIQIGIVKESINIKLFELKITPNKFDTSTTATPGSIIAEDPLFATNRRQLNARKEDAINDKPSVSMMCKNNAINIDELSSRPKVIPTMVVANLEGIEEVEEHEDDDDESESASSALKSSNQIKQIHESIDERIKIVLNNNNCNNTADGLRDNDEMLKNINELELSESLMALSKKIAKSLDINYEDIMKANITEDIIQITPSPKENEKNDKNAVESQFEMPSLDEQILENLMRTRNSATTSELEVMKMLATSDENVLEKRENKKSCSSSPSSSTLTSLTTGSSKTSVQSSYIKRSQGKLFSSLSFLKNRQKSTVDSTEKTEKTDKNAKKVKESERKKEEASKKLEAKKIERREFIAKKNNAKARTAELKKSKTADNIAQEEKPRKSSSVASSMRRMFAPRFESKSSTKNLTPTEQQIPNSMSREGSSGSSVLSQNSTYTMKKPFTIRVPMLSNQGNGKDKQKTPLTARSAATKADTNTTETMASSTRTIFTRTLPLNKNEANDKALGAGVKGKPNCTQTVRTSECNLSRTTITLDNASHTLQDVISFNCSKNMQGNGDIASTSISASAEELRKINDSTNLIKKCQPSKLAVMKSPHSFNMRRNTDLCKTNNTPGGGSTVQVSQSARNANTRNTNFLNVTESDRHEKFSSQNNLASRWLSNVNDKGAYPKTATGLSSNNNASASPIEGIVDVKKLVKNFSCLTDRNIGVVAKGPLNIPKDDTKLKTQHSTSEIPKQVQPTSARSAKQQTSSPPTSSRSKLPRDTVASQLRKIEIQKRQNLFLEDSHSNSAEQNIKMSQYLFK